MTQGVHGSQNDPTAARIWFAPLPNAEASWSGTKVMEQMLRFQLTMFDSVLKFWMLPFSAIHETPSGTAKTSEAGASTARTSAIPQAIASAPATELAKPAPDPKPPMAAAAAQPDPIASSKPTSETSPSRTVPSGKIPSKTAAPNTADISPPAKAAAKTPDDLERIVGIGPKLKKTLNALGVSRFDQIAAWSPAEVASMNAKIAFNGRIEREGWQVQAARLARRGGAGEAN